MWIQHHDSGRVHLYHGPNFHGTNLYQNICSFFENKKAKELFSIFRFYYCTNTVVSNKAFSLLCKVQNYTTHLTLSQLLVTTLSQPGDDCNDHIRDGLLVAFHDIWTEGLDVRFDDIHGAMEYCSGDNARSITKLHKWVHEVKPGGTL